MDGSHSCWGGAVSQSPMQCSILSLGVRGLSSFTISVLLLCTEKVPNEKKVKSLSHVRLFATSWTVAYQAPLSMEFSRQEYWSGLPFPSPGVLPDPGIKPGSPTLQTLYHLSHLGSPKECEVEVAQLCLTLCDPTDYTVHGILQARILEWVTFPFSRGSSQPRDRTQVSCIAGGFFTRSATGSHSESKGFPGGAVVQNLPPVQETQA